MCAMSIKERGASTSIWWVIQLTFGGGGCRRRSLLNLLFYGHIYGSNTLFSFPCHAIPHLLLQKKREISWVKSRGGMEYEIDIKRDLELIIRREWNKKLLLVLITAAINRNPPIFPLGLWFYYQSPRPHADLILRGCKKWSCVHFTLAGRFCFTSTNQHRGIVIKNSIWLQKISRVIEGSYNF